MSIKFNFYWDHYYKRTTSMLIGTSPELELALFTLCIKTRLDEGCHVSLGGSVFVIRAKSQPDKAELQSVYFNL